MVFLSPGPLARGFSFAYRPTQELLARRCVPQSLTSIIISTVRGACPSCRGNRRASGALVLSARGLSFTPACLTTTTLLRDRLRTGQRGPPLVLPKGPYVPRVGSRQCGPITHLKSVGRTSHQLSPAPPSSSAARRCAGRAPRTCCTRPCFRTTEAIGDQVMNALPAHVGEVHRRAGRVLGDHSTTSVAIA